MKTRCHENYLSDVNKVNRKLETSFILPNLLLLPNKFIFVRTALNMYYIYILLLLILSVNCLKEFERPRRSISCKLSSRGCKWSCRLRGYIYGDCDQEDHCNCKEVKHNYTYIDQHY